MTISVKKHRGKKGVVIREDEHGIELLAMLNGYQWIGMPIDDELIDMLQDTISEFKERRNYGKQRN